MATKADWGDKDANAWRCDGEWIEWAGRGMAVKNGSNLKVAVAGV